MHNLIFLHVLSTRPKSRSSFINLNAFFNLFKRCTVSHQVESYANVLQIKRIPFFRSILTIHKIADFPFLFLQFSSLLPTLLCSFLCITFSKSIFSKWFRIFLSNGIHTIHANLSFIFNVLILCQTTPYFQKN